MGNCGSGLQCDACYAKGGGWEYNNVTAKNVTCKSVLEADADIVGNGVLFAFLISAVLTCGAVVVGYLSDSLSESDWNQVDDMFVKWFQATYLKRKILPKLSHFYKASKALSLRRTVNADASSLTRNERSKALLKFILVFSDQQLVTGLAMLIAGSANRCRISYYEFRVVACLGWFSLTTHLGTLDVLKYYMIRHPTVRNWRVLGMIVTMILLIFALVTIGLSGPTGQRSDDTLINPLQCVFDHPSEFNYIGVGFTISMILSPYIGRVLSLYNSDTKNEEARYQVQRRIWQRNNSGTKSSSPESPKNRTKGGPEHEDPPRGEEREGIRMSLHSKLLLRKFRMTSTDKNLLQSLFLQAVAERHSPEERVKRSKISAPVRGRRGLKTLARKFTLNIDHIRLYEDSFLSNFSSMIFFLAYGLAQTILVRWKNGPMLGETARRMDFGQIVSLFLLALPLLAAVEIYSEAQKDHDADRSALATPSQDGEISIQNVNKTAQLPNPVSHSGEERISQVLTAESLEMRPLVRNTSRGRTDARPSSESTLPRTNAGSIQSDGGSVRESSVRDSSQEPAHSLVTNLKVSQQVKVLDREAAMAGFRYFAYDATISLLDAISLNTANVYFLLVVMFVQLIVNSRVFVVKIGAFKNDHRFYAERVASLLVEELKSVKQHQPNSPAELESERSDSRTSSSGSQNTRLGVQRTHTPEPLGHNDSDNDWEDQYSPRASIRQDTEADMGILPPSRL
ncbi:hypothetical protein BU16DRAFT_91486 [Lophium mytilinum]|uniref:Uncharacterized protein n=1 Tax=Lophium mytilinum TaxID=390894 RepID=A0A6A6QL69_9PEZI|nr:hypothetical protein BU16DRAFT_91486 [Lophium mytilinum]